MLPGMRITASECLENAKVCLRWADMARSVVDRSAYIDLAHTWIQASARAETQSPAGSDPFRIQPGLLNRRGPLARGTGGGATAAE